MNFRICVCRREFTVKKQVKASATDITACKSDCKHKAVELVCQNFVNLFFKEKTKKKE